MWPPNALRYIDEEVIAPGRLTAPVTPGRMIVFIHGYNNDREEAEDSYRQVMERLPDADREAVWQFFWPGFIERLTGAPSDRPLSLAPRRDTRQTESGNPLISAASYPLQVRKARDVGRALGRFLDGVRPDTLIFVAHSLGCRVALEAIRFLTSVTASRRASMAGACLMAAAVPTYMVDSSPGRPAGDLCSAARAIVRSFVLHSTNDFVLRTAFRIGQTSIGEGFLPVAVGFNGGPDTPWSGRGNTGLGHSGYWTHSAAAPATLRAIGHAGADVLRELQSHPGVTWTLSTDAPPPDRQLTERRWRRVGRRSMLA